MTTLARSAVWVRVEKQCRCVEGRILHFAKSQPTGEWHPAPRVHNCRYIRERNLLIPAAEDLAAESGRQGSPEWVRAFSRAMHTLAERQRAAGLL